MAHHVFRRPLVSDSPYADIAATSPAHFVPLEYASTPADGQILYEDSAGSTILDAQGDPIGGVEWDGVIVATQSTDADRPTWNGEGAGAEFNRSVYLDTGQTFDFFSGSPWYFGAKCSWTPSTQDIQCLAGNQLGSGNPGVTFQIDNRGGDREFRIIANSVYSFGTGTAPNDTNEHVFEFVQPSSGAVDLYVDGVLTASVSVSIATTTDTMLIGAQKNVNNLFDGEMAVLVFDDKVPSYAGEGVLG
jgi:hypothetical protein